MKGKKTDESRINVFIDEVVARSARVQASAEGTKLNDIVERALKSYLPSKTRSFASNVTITEMQPNK